MQDAVIMAISLNQVELVEHHFNRESFDIRILSEEDLSFLYGFQSRRQSSILKYSGLLYGNYPEMIAYTEATKRHERKVYKLLCHFKDYQTIYIKHGSLCDFIKNCFEVFHRNTNVHCHFTQVKKGVFCV